jgi:hypothetical protein
MQKHLPHRPVIYSKDVMNITQLSHSACCALLQAIRKHLGKTKNQFVTVEEFCQYTGIPEKVVVPFMI